jgi:lipopolysaccharide assembly outer membrane protein LptD (OstA)
LEEGVTNSFHRYDIFPSISWPITYLSWLTVTPAYGYRVTHWSEQKSGAEIVEDPLTRRYSEVTLDLRGPNFGKIFDTPGNGYSKKWKHAIEPRVTYSHRQDIANQNNIIGVDSDIDFIQGTKSVTYSLTNLLYAKRPVKDEKEYDPDEFHFYDPEPLEPPIESAWEFVSWRLSQTYFLESDSFDPDNPNQEELTPISSVVRVNPSQHYNVQFSTDYDINFHQMTRLQLTSTLRNPGRWRSDISYVYSNPTSIQVRPGQVKQKAGNSFQTNGAVGLWNNRIALQGDLGYDITQHKFLSGGLGVTWNDDCFSVGVQFRHFDEVFRTDGKENQITFSISLPNIGNLVNFQSGSSSRY